MMGDFGDGSLFREIGNTLQDVGQEVLLGTVSSLKTAVARRVVASQEGQTVAIQSALPFIILAVIAFLLFRRFVMK
jgi:hypothetical protein